MDDYSTTCRNISIVAFAWAICTSLATSLICYSDDSHRCGYLKNRCIDYYYYNY